MEIDDLDLLLSMADDDVPASSKNSSRIRDDPDDRDPLRPIKTQLRKEEMPSAPSARKVVYSSPPKPQANRKAFAAVGHATSSNRVAQGSDISKNEAMDKFSGLRLKNRLLSSLVVLERFKATRFFRIGGLRSANVGTDTWGTVGVLVSKMKPRESASGQKWSVWKLSDLDRNDVSLFLFGQAYTDHWKESEGAVLGIRGAKLKKDEKGELSMSADQPDVVWKIGTSVDLGTCRAERRDGTPCTNHINKSQLEYCQYHLRQAASALSNPRMELSGGNLTSSLKKKIKPAVEKKDVLGMSRQPLRVTDSQGMRSMADSGIGKKNGSVGARNLNAIANRLDSQSSRAALEKAALAPAWARSDSLRGRLNTGSASRSAGAQMDRKKPQARMLLETDMGMEEAVVECANKQAASNEPSMGRSYLQMILGSQELKKGGLECPDPNASSLKQVNPNGPEADDSHLKARRPSHSARDNLALLMERSKPPAACSSAASASLHRLKSGSSEAAASGTKGTTSSRPGANKREAPSTSSEVGRHGNHPEIGSSDVPPGKKPRVHSGHPEGPGPASKPGPAPPRHAEKAAAHDAGKSGATGGSFAALFAKPRQEMEEKGSNSKYKAEAETEAEDLLLRRLDHMEKRDTLNSKLEATTKITIDAWKCLECEKTSSRCKEECRQEGHTIQKVKAVMRWFKCNGCKTSTKTIDQKVPTSRCRRCQGTSFTATGMPGAKTKVGSGAEELASRENMKARGVEHDFSLKT
ncbi:hypothetical protein CYMTET_18738 [Cymbomonas tetramitiformis]|uniref:Protein MCM10 homolog n=1 Tax=Cymbomonas tetramitiformis TaxID=36881 RepID=A0AAE0G7G1_9CHLO|nr:hypothetical protein CYMTET_18738 [Cymbomonas tetramitiformis]